MILTDSMDISYIPPNPIYIEIGRYYYGHVFETLPDSQSDSHLFPASNEPQFSFFAITIPTNRLVVPNERIILLRIQKFVSR